jgi:hypothetical protein
MKKGIWNLWFLMLSIIASGQTEPLKKYDFEKGGYSIVGIFAESDPNGLRDSLGEFYIRDLAVLNQWKKEWSFEVPGKQYACGYHYMIYVCRNGAILERFALNLNCNEIVSDQGAFYFDAQKLRLFKGLVQKAFKQVQRFKSIDEGKKERTQIMQDSSLLFVENPMWATFEGEFQFTYKCPAKTQDDEATQTQILTLIETEIK